jgi:hypothetical protein
MGVVANEEIQPGKGGLPAGEAGDVEWQLGRYACGNGAIGEGPAAYAVRRQRGASIRPGPCRGSGP